jgi:two-component sensor histidine kinase
MSIPTPPAATGFLTLVDPAAETEKAAMAAAPRLRSLAGAHLAMVDNSKHNAAALLKSLEAVLVAEHGVASIEFHRKDNPSVALPVDAMDLIASRCSAVIHGVAD